MVSDRPRFHLDEHIPPLVATALRRRGIDVTTSVEAGLRAADDLAHLEYARSERRVIVTHDADYLRHHVHGIQHAGIAYCRMGDRTVGQIIEMLRLMHEVLTADELDNRVEYL